MGAIKRGIMAIFHIPRNLQATRWRELGSYTAIFSSFGPDMYRSDIVKSCIRTLALHTSKANAVSDDAKIARLLNIRPNPYMSGPEMLKKLRTIYEVKGTAFLYLTRDDKGNTVEVYPVPYQSFEAIESRGMLFIKFYFEGDAAREIVLPWEDLVPLRNDYFRSDICGEDNGAIIPKLELVNTIEQGIGNAIKSTANLRGIIKAKLGMLTDEDKRKMRDNFVKDYMGVSNEGGVAALDSSQDFIPITMSPTVTSTSTIKEFREDAYRYFGLNDHIIMSDFTEEQMEAFYDAKIEPFLVMLSTALTDRIFTWGKKYVMYESSRINFASTKTKLGMVALVDRGALTPNEWRRMFNLAPVEGGDKPIRRLDTAEVNKGDSLEEEEKTDE